MDLREALADPRPRLGLGVAGLLATAGAVHRDRVGTAEARTFRAVNGLPAALYPPAWVVVQLGAFGAVPAAAGGAALGLAANAAVDLALPRPAGESVRASGISRMPDGAPARILEA